mgnify:CR=1 FL=1
MRILVFTSLFPNNIHTEHGIFIKNRLLRLSKSHGYNVIVLAPVPYAPSWFPFEPWSAYSRVKKEESIDVMTIYHPRYPLVPKLSMPLHGLLMYAACKRFVDKHLSEFPYDLIDGHYIYPDCLAAALLGKAFQKPVFVSARGSDVNQFTRFKAIKPQIKWTLEQAEHVVSVCSALKQEMVDLGIAEHKISVVPNGVDTNTFTLSDRTTARQRLAIASGEKVILSVGSLIERKGFDYLIQAMPHVLESYSHACLYLIGAGPEEQHLRGLAHRLNIAEHVVFVGQVPNPDLPSWYNAADVFCLASSREGWANVIMESLACGTPVVATNVWGAPEIITNPSVGLLVDRTVEDIAGGLCRTLSRQWDRDLIAEHVRKRDWDAVADELHALYSQKLSKDV